MKKVKMLGLASMAALALTVLGGASTASATVLCKTNLTSGCAAAGWDYPKETTVHLVLEGNAVMNAIWTDVECKKTTVELKTTNTGGASETVSANIESLTPEECRCAGGSFGSAHATTISKGSGEVHHISGTDNGTLTGKNTVITLNCTNLGTQCRFGTGNGIHVGSVTGGVRATAHGDADLVWTSGSNDEGSFLCGSTAVWEAKYEVTSPEPLYVAAS